MNLIEGSFVALLAETVIVSLSGVMAPGPLSAVALGHGSRAGSAGAWIAMGHGVVEFPLMLGLFLGLGCLQEFGTVSSLVGLSGGMVLLVLGVGHAARGKIPRCRLDRKPLGPRAGDPSDSFQSFPLGVVA